MSVGNEPVVDGMGLDRQRRVRRSALWLAALALAFYVGFIIMSVRSAHG